MTHSNLKVEVQGTYILVAMRGTRFRAECVADAFAAWRPSSFTQYIERRTASREESSRPLLGGLGDNKRK
jgi:hypothetical protein